MLVGLGVVVAALVVAGRPGGAQQAQSRGDWPSITGDDAGTRYATIDQINASNFNNLKVTWEWNGEVPGGENITDINARSLPIYVDGNCSPRRAPGARSCRWIRRPARRCGRLPSR